MTDDEILNNLFYNKHIVSQNELYKNAKMAHPRITKLIVSTWYNKQNVNKVTKQEVGTKYYLPIFSEVSYAFQIDLTFFPRYTDQNKGYNVLFTAININTRFVYAYYSKDKKAETILNFIKKMNDKTVINSLSCDEGSEFKNKKFIEYCNNNNITLYFINDDSHKLGIINRFHRTLKEKLTKYFLSHKTLIWFDVIDSIINIYNKSVNRGIGIAPIKVNDFIENEIIESKRKQTGIIKVKEKLFEVGDIVIKKNKKELFGDKMSAKYSNKQYVITKLFINSINLMDSDGVKSKSKKSQLQKVEGGQPFINENNDIIDTVNVVNKSKNKFKRAGLDLKNVINDRKTRSGNIK